MSDIEEIRNRLQKFENVRWRGQLDDVSEYVKQTIDNLTKENTKLMEQLKDIKSQLFDVNNCDTILTLAIEQLLNK